MLMIESDLRPSQLPDTEDWQDALQKGLGRALRWATNGVFMDRAILLNACLTDLRYDRQCEEARGSWLWRIIEATGAVEDFREPILESLRMINDGLAAQQLCQFCVFYALRGDHKFRRCLQRIVSDKPVPDCPWLGEEELIELDNGAGFLYAAKARARSLPHREWEYDDKSMMNMAIEKLGQKASELLAHEAESSPELRLFFEIWNTEVEKKADEQKQSHADYMRQYTLNDIIRVAEATPNRAGFLRGWGMYASESDLQAVLGNLFNSHNPEVIASYLRVFSNRPLPCFDDRMLGLLEHGNEQIRSRAYAAVAKNAHPAIRTFALDHLLSHDAELNFINLFIKNYQLGDEDLLLTHLRLPEDQDDRHWLLLDVTKILEHNPAARCDALALWAYRWTPCGSCRHGAAKLLIDRNVAPEWLLEECQYDSDPDTRRLAKMAAS